MYKWTGRNDYVALCEPEYISFGGGCVNFFTRCGPRLTVQRAVTATTACISTRHCRTDRLRGAPHSITSRCARLGLARAKMSPLNVSGWKCGALAADTHGIM